MKNLITLIFLLGLFIPALWSQSPNGINYQAIVRNTNGKAIVNRSVSLRFSILQDAAAGTVVYKETHIAATNQFGLVNLAIGRGTVVTGIFSSIDWGDHPYFLKTELDSTGGNNYMFMGTSQLLSVPYCLYSNNGVPTGQDQGDMLYWTGTKWTKVPAGENGQILTFADGIPTWGQLPDQLPEVSTTPVTNITVTTATSGGTIADDGGADVTSRGVCWNTSPNPTTTNNKSANGGGLGGFTSNLTGLTSNTSYYVRAYATSAAGTGYGNEVNFLTLTAFVCGQTLIYDGKGYPTVQIGTQCWFKENLNIGTRINAVLAQTNNTVIEKYCYNDLVSNCDVYGGLYQWDEMMDYTLSSNANPSGRQGICPVGWHLPSDAEWCVVTTFLDPTVNCSITTWSGTDAGGKLKETGISHWATPNSGATNASSFTAVPAGYRTGNGTFTAINNNNYMSSSTEVAATTAYYRNLYYNYASVSRGSNAKTSGYTVRCLKD